MKPNKKVETPSHFIFYDTETRSKTLSPTEEELTLKLGVAIYHRVRENEHKEDNREVIVFRTPSEFWDFVESKCFNKVKLYVFSHNQDFDFNVVNGWNELEKRNWKIKFQVSETGVFIAVFRKEKKTLVVLDLFNYFKTSLEELGHDIGLEKLKVNFEKCSEQELIEYCKRDTEIVEKTILMFRQFLKENDLGNFRYTIASQSLTAFKHRFNKYKIEIHNHEEALRLGRLSYRGGKNVAYAIGKLPRKNYYYKLDLNSGYPNLMLLNEYPIKFLKFFDAQPKRLKKSKPFKFLRKLLGEEKEEKYYPSENKKILMKYLFKPHYCVIARVLVKTETDFIGVRKNKKLIFPTGIFECVLTTRELEYLVEQYGWDAVIDVGQISVYKSAKIFSDFVNFFYNLKLKYEEEGNKSFRMFAKYMLNTLSGKWGQQNTKTVEVKDNKRGKSGYEIIYDVEKKMFRRFFSFGGKTWEYTREKEEAEDSFVEISSHITADQRVLISRLSQFVIDNGGKVFYVDTDSLVVDNKGYKILKEEPYRVYGKNLESFIGKNIGQLKVELRCRNLEIHGAKDYVFGKEVKRKGIKHDAKQVGENVFVQKQFPSSKRIIRDKGRIIVKTVTKKLNRKYDKGLLIPNKEGYFDVIPFEINELEGGIV